MESRDILGEFLEQYQPEGRNEPITTAEQSLIKDALVDFLVIEQWVTNAVDGSVAERAVRQLRLLCPSSPAQSAITTLESFVLDLIGRLSRREQANLIMREHLTMMSHEIGQLKAQLSQAPQ